MTIVAWFSGAIVGPPSVLIMFAGHMAVVIGLWPVHVTCTYRTLALTKKLGIVLKVLSLVLLSVNVRDLNILIRQLLVVYYLMFLRKPVLNFGSSFLMGTMLRYIILVQGSLRQ
jgi:hypothetical protein